MRATRRSLPNTFKPVTEPASRRQNGPALSEGPRNGTQIGQIPNSHSPVQPVESAAASGSFQGTVEHFMSLGYPEKLVLTALKSTSLKQGYPTTVVLEKLQKGEGIPEYHEGVWTAKDDESLRYIISYEKLMEEGSAQHGGVVDDERKMRRKVERENKRLTVKHGQEGIELRSKYFKMWDGE
ncbi:putative transcription factor protein [Phaeoacremonium minimum UCRPA7]|uniref:Putative transcription factor protein n=1 Tax=Phaeoacremonium minimum (strain UCR-PA7) TaxID=1286976 RepID=R8BD11_PHAM7|nr:putative transcription factor protein [Phaeoacremonium minimum UCRPA7]EON97181.1 putative transcription factor protein [Phaeoacremonium minimum UCRPA7]